MIFTFYSYKGGVGRSMAMANVAHWLYLRGRDVIMVDWDLEAPGLENFFYRSDEQLERARAHLGVIDLLSSYRRQAPYTATNPVFNDLPPLSGFLLNVIPEAPYAPEAVRTPGQLRLLTAGWRSGERFVEYAETVQGFDWAEFYTRHRGEEYFDWFRNQLLSLGDVVFIDSRTGVSEMSGVCTRQLADVVVVVCAPNAQNLRGTIDMVESFVSPEVEKARGRRLEVLIFPSRVDDQDSKGHEQFRVEFLDVVQPYTPQLLREWNRSPWDLEIPYKAQYSYRESLVTGVEGANEKLELAYRELTAHLALLSEEGGPVWQACEPELKVLAARAGRELTDRAWLRATAAIAHLSDTEREQVRTVLLRLVRLSPQASILDARRRASVDDFHLPARPVLSRLESIGVVARLPERAEHPEQFELAHEALVKNWASLQEWIGQDRDFLLWRQEIGDRAARWRDSPNDSAQLLRGSVLDEVRRWEDRFSDLNALERSFVDASAAHAVLEKAEGELERYHVTASRDYELMQARVFRAQAVAATLFLAMIAAMMLLARASATDVELTTRAREVARVRAVLQGLEIKAARAEEFDKRVAVINDPRARPSRRGLPLTRTLRGQVHRLQREDSDYEARRSRNHQLIAGSALALTLAGSVVLLAVLGVRFQLQGFARLVTSKLLDAYGEADQSPQSSAIQSQEFNSRASQWRSRLETLTDPLGSPATSPPLAIALMSVACVIAVQVIGIYWASDLWGRSLAMKASLVMVLVGGAVNLGLAAIYAFVRYSSGPTSAFRSASNPFLG
jgi:hypothetical protein